MQHYPLQKRPCHWPPQPDRSEESEGERLQRQDEEKEAKRLSDLIDKGLEEEKAVRKARKVHTRILLLGMLRQSPSDAELTLPYYQAKLNQVCDIEFLIDTLLSIF